MNEWKGNERMPSGRKSTLGKKISPVPCASDELFAEQLGMLAEVKDLPIGDVVRLAIEKAIGSELTDEKLPELFFEKVRSRMNELKADELTA